MGRIRGTNDKSKGVVILLLWGATAFTTVVALELGGTNWFLVWAIAGIPFLVAVLMPVLLGLERSGIDTDRWAWLLQDTTVGIWILGVVGLYAAQRGLSIHAATLFGLLIIAAGAIAIHYASYKMSSGVLEWEYSKWIVGVGLTVIVGGIIILSFVPSPRWVIVDWPCRQEQWELEHGSHSGSLDAFRALWLCEGRSPEQVQRDIEAMRQVSEQMRRQLREYEEKLR